MNFLKFIMALIMIVVAGYFLLCAFSWIVPIKTLDDGKHAGQVTTIEKSGLIFKTWNVYVKSDISSSQEDVYCVIDEQTDLLKRLDEYSQNRTKIVLFYNDYLSVPIWKCDIETDGIIVDVQE